jgi:hypothetical protein
MAVKSVDAFTGADDVDITGRTPDGGGSGSLAVGTWQRCPDSPGDGTFDILASAMLAGYGTTGNNAASLAVEYPGVRPSGSYLGILAYTRNLGARTPSTPTGFSIHHEADDGTQRLVLYYRLIDGTEGSGTTLSFTGAGAAGTDVMAFAFCVADVTVSPLGQEGLASTWLSADNLGPVDGITPDEADSIVLLCAAKNNDFNGSATATGFSLANLTESTAGNDAGMVLMWQEQVGGPTAISDTTITDTGAVASNGTGVGFMVELKRGATSASRCVTRTPSGLTDFVHYVCEDIPDIGGLTGTFDYMVEASWDVFQAGQGLFGVLARHHRTPFSGYDWNFAPLDGDGNGILSLGYFWEGSLSEIRLVSHTVDPTQPVTLRMCISGPNTDVDFKCYCNDVQIIPDDGTLDPLGIFIHNPPGGQEIDGGFPGACMQDDSRVGAGIKLRRWLAAESCDDTETPCTGPPENPYPTDPPPVPTPPAAGEFPMQRGAWRFPIVPSWGQQRGAFRQTGATLETIRKWVMANGVWREIVAAAGETDPPPDTDLPPYYDPCELYPALPIPTEPLGAVPARLFFAFDLPITTMTQIFNGAMNALGSHTPGNLSQATARGGVIIGAQGGYSKFLNPNYSQALMDSWIEGHAPYMGTVLAAQTAGDFYGQQVMDDHASVERWPPSGISVAEISRIAAKWKTEYPGIRVGIRARAGQFSGSNYPSNVDFIIAQYRFWGIGQTPAAFVDTELTLAAARSWDVLFSVNIENGGLGPSSPYGGTNISHRVMYEMGPGELLAAWGAMLVDVSHMHGIGMWKYSAGVMTPDNLNVMATIRNALAAMGPP